MEILLQSNSIYQNKLSIRNFSLMLKDPTQCYKFYWFEAILTLMQTTGEDISFDSIINEMICAAWYSIVNYHLHLGPSINGKAENYLEHAVRVLENDFKVDKYSSKEELLLAIRLNEKLLQYDKRNLAKHVPYRLLSPFLNQVGGNDAIWNRKKNLVQHLKDVDACTPLPYVIIDGRGLEKKVRINPHWRQLMLDNYPVIRSWIQLKKVRFLQDRNPGVPGIIYKLEEHEASVRKLKNARALWKTVAEVSNRPIWDIYTGQLLTGNQFDLDHYIPWSYVTNDELWNLTPMDGRLNSSKSNKLPKWEAYFRSLAKNQYFLYEMIFSNELVRKQFEKCRRDNLNAIWAAESLYVEGNSEEQFRNILEHNMKPLYESARLQGYELWNPSCAFPEDAETLFKVAE